MSLYVYSLQTLYSIPGSPVSSGSDPSPSPYEWKGTMCIEIYSMVEIEETENLAVTED